MKKSSIIAIVLGIIVILAAIVAIFLIIQKSSTITPNTSNTNHVQTSVSSNTRTVINLQQGSIEPTTLDLGTISNHAFGLLYTPSIPLIVGKAGTYTFYLVNIQDLEKDFPDFIINMSINGKHVALGWLKVFGVTQYTTSSIYLSPGEYNLSMVVNYVSSLTVNSTNFDLPVVELGYGPTIYKLINIELSLSNQTPQIKLQTNPSIINTTTLNLGTISNSGSATDLTNITIKEGEYYTFWLLNFPKINNDFLNFVIILQISNETMTHKLLFGECPLFEFADSGALYQKYTMYLSPGTYSLYISLQYEPLYIGNKTVTFNETMIGLGYGSTVYPLLNVSFSLQPLQSTFAPEEGMLMNPHPGISFINTNFAIISRLEYTL